MDWLPINFGLLRHPVNWLTIWVILFLGGFIVHLAMTYHTGKDNG